VRDKMYCKKYTYTLWRVGWLLLRQRESC